MKLPTEELTPKDVAELDAFAFDFSRRLNGQAISSATVTVEVHTGADASPLTMLSGIPVIDAATGVVRQSLQGGVDGVIYRVRCVATLNGSPARQLTAAFLLPVQRF